MSTSLLVFSCDMEKTRDRIQKLRDYYMSAGWEEDSTAGGCFACIHYDACKASQNDDRKMGFRGQVAKVGPLYDTQFNGKNIRVLIIGKESAQGNKTVLTDIDRGLLGCMDPNWSKNNHIVGTLQTLQDIYQVSPGEIPNAHTTGVVKLYANFALSNALKCAFKHENSERSGIKHTETMLDNCYDHLLNEIGILEPTLIISQGRWATQRSLVDRLALKYGASEFEPADGYSDIGMGLYRFGRFDLIISHHPSRLDSQWRARLAQKTLFPQLDRLRELGVLPPAGDYRFEYDKAFQDIIDSLYFKAFNA